MKRIRPAIVTVTLLAGLVVAVPARPDQACDAALATIARATATLDQMQALSAAILKRQQEALASTVTPPDNSTQQGAFIFLDIQPKANHTLTDDLHGQEGNNLKGVPQGEQKLAGVSYKIGPKMVHLRGNHAQEMPEKVEGITVERAIGHLHILHGTGYNLDNSTEIGAYIVHYADGSDERIPIVYGEDVRDWWANPEPPDLKRAKLAWTGMNPAASSNQSSIHLYSLDWVNPHPNAFVRSLDFVSRNTECDPFLVALSIEKP